MRYLLKLSYDGKNYFGFQKQKNKDTIQERLENALSQVLSTEIKIIASGRTDAGVSAILQICHFDIETQIDKKRTIGYVNSLLPKDIKVLDIQSVDDSFHARFSAKKKTYEYYFYIGYELPVYEKFATYIGYNIDILAMQEACKHFIGVHDFTAFCSSNTEVQDKIREIYSLTIQRIDDDLYKLVVSGNGFLYNMVRIIMGTLVSVGLGKLKPSDINHIIASKNRDLAGKTMPSKALILKNVEY